MSEKEARTLNWGIEFFDRVVVGLTVSTELFWIDDRNTRGPLGAIRHYCWLHIGKTEIENGDYRAFEIILPFAHLAIAVLRREEKE